MVAAPSLVPSAAPPRKHRTSTLIRRDIRCYSYDTASIAPPPVGRPSLLHLCAIRRSSFDVLSFAPPPTRRPLLFSFFRHIKSTIKL
ncbi:hypothetical protein LINPERPRIM_LOCUS40731 [Linum perenne]